MKTRKSKAITLMALGIAIIFILTRFTQIPIPFGYMHFGNVAILLACAYLDPFSAMIVSAAGSALADLTSFPVWVIPTIIIKGVMALAGSCVMGEGYRSIRLNSPRIILGCLASACIMIFGYFVSGVFMYGGVAASATQLPGLTFEGVAAIVLFFVIANVLEKAKVTRLLSD